MEYTSLIDTSLDLNLKPRRVLDDAHLVCSLLESFQEDDSFFFIYIYMYIISIIIIAETRGSKQFYGSVGKKNACQRRGQ